MSVTSGKTLSKGDDKVAEEEDCEEASDDVLVDQTILYK